MWGQAVFDVEEGTPEIRLNITGGDEDDNLVVIDITFDGVDGIFGVHRLPLGLDAPESAGFVASLDGRLYYPEDGQLELSLVEGRHIEGHFEGSVREAAAPTGSGGEPEFEAGGAPIQLGGGFDGGWNVHCVSPLVGFTGSHVVEDSAYCMALAL
jgi:hypothetical protein